MGPETEKNAADADKLEQLDFKQNVIDKDSMLASSTNLMQIGKLSKIKNQLNKNFL